MDVHLKKTKVLMWRKKYPYYARGKVHLDENSETEDHRYGQERMKTQFSYDLWF